MKNEPLEGFIDLRFVEHFVVEIIVTVDQWWLKDEGIVKLELLCILQLYKYYKKYNLNVNILRNYLHFIIVTQ